MNKNNIFIFILFGIIYCSHFGLSFAGRVNCECPSISAKGTGNTSCSATENIDECTIDYNQFDPIIIEEAKSFVSQYTLRSIKYKHIRQSQQLFKLSPDNLVDQLLIYMMVAFVQSRKPIIVTKQLSEQLSVSFQSMQTKKNANKIHQAFHDESRRHKNSYKNKGVYVTNGCIELRIGNKFWVMYKNDLSKVASHPQCSKYRDN